MAKGIKGLTAGILVVAVIAVVGAVETRKLLVQGQVNLDQDLEKIEPTDKTGDKELAAKIVAEVRAMIDIPDDVEPTVATIIDVDQLRSQNPFYNKAENGDHLIVTAQRAILYSSKKKMILDVVPVQLQPVEAAQTEEGSEEE